MAPEKHLVNARYLQIDFGKTEGWTCLARTTKTGTASGPHRSRPRDRGRRGVALTPAGQVLLRHARSVRHAVGQLRTELDEYAQGHGATVRVQANTAATESLMPAAAVSFLARYPHARIDLEERPSHR